MDPPIWPEPRLPISSIQSFLISLAFAVRVSNVVLSIKSLPPGKIYNKSGLISMVNPGAADLPHATKKKFVKKYQIYKKNLRGLDLFFCA
jgi:hypothetical protein